MKDKKGLLIGILLVIILALAGYIAVDKLILAKKVTAETIKKNSNNNVNINLNALHQISNTINQFDDAFGDINSTYFGYIYKQDKILAKNFDKTAALYLALHNDLIPSTASPYLIGAKVKSKYEKIFGKQLAYAPGNIAAGNFCNIVYNAGNDTYFYNYQNTSNMYSPEYLTYTVSTKIKDDKVIVTRKAYYVEYSNNGGANISTAIIYADSDKSVKIGQLSLRNNALNEKEVIDKFNSKLKTYEYTFIEKKEDDYSFYSIKKIK